MSGFTDCRYTDAAQTTILAVRDGIELNINVAPDNPLYNDLLLSGETIAAYEPPPVDLVAYLKAKRYACETGGIIVGGAAIATDRESQAMVNGAYAMALRDAERTFNWQTDAGFVTLSAAAIIAIAVAVGDHVQACFDFQAATAAAIEAETITTAAQIDALDWPVSS